MIGKETVGRRGFFAGLLALAAAPWFASKMKQLPQEKGMWLPAVSPVPHYDLFLQDIICDDDGVIVNVKRSYHRSPNGIHAIARLDE
jgi:hypothetical protein